jgi:predicted lipid-binding transport protein (Tim44 family)
LGREINAMFRYRFLIALAAMATAIVLVAADAQARAGGGFSAGSRGMRTFSMPPTTRTAPNSAAPIQRTITQPGSATTTGLGSGARPGLFGGGLFGGLAAGFLGAGLFGLLFGHGLFGGMAGFASIIGLLLQVVLVVIVARLIFAWWQRRHMPAYAAAHPATGHGFAGLGGMLGASAPAGEPLTIAAADYDAFEDLLVDIEAGYSAEDLTALRAKVTPEMLSYFSEQLAENASRGLVDRVTGVKLLQGDLAEAWREGNVDYTTVAMRFALTDSMVERASGRTVEGGSASEVTELWTFRRARGGNWLLSAIQQT